MTRPGLFAVASGVFALVLAWLALAAIRYRPTEGTVRPPASRVEAPPALVLPEKEAAYRFGATTEGARTIEDVLADYWGDQWPAVKAEAGRQSLDITQMTEAEPTPWEEIRPEIVERFKATAQGFGEAWQDKYLWPKETTALVLAERLGFAGPVTPYKLQVAHSAAMAHQDVIRNQIKRKQDVLSQALEEVILQDRIDRGPYFLPKSALDDQDRGPSQFASSLSYKGWVVAVTIPRADFALLDEVSAELRRLCRVRDQAVRETL